MKDSLRHLYIVLSSGIRRESRIYLGNDAARLPQIRKRSGRRWRGDLVAIRVEAPRATFFVESTLLIAGCRRRRVTAGDRIAKFRLARPDPAKGWLTRPGPTALYRPYFDCSVE